MKKLWVSLLAIAVATIGTFGTVAYAAGEADVWDGTSDTDWYNDTDTTFTLNTAEQLAGFGELVDAGNKFAGKIITLGADLDLKYVADSATEPTSFSPIGDKSAFAGTFDGDGHTISNLYQSGWAFGYEWGKYGSLGLFGELEGATIKNLTVKDAECFVEGGDVGGITGSATGTCLFENVTISDSVFATYNNGCAGIIGWSGAGNYTFKNVKIDDGVVLAGLWGSFDSSIGGVVGQAEPGATYDFENVDIACRLDVYNDCTASYDYYNYRMCGMIIGRLQETVTIDGKNYPDMSKYNINCNDVNVTIGEWANYHYCEPTPGLNNGRGMRVEAGYAYDGLPEDYDHSQCTDNHMSLINFETLFGGQQLAVKGANIEDVIMLDSMLASDIADGIAVKDLAKVARSEAKIGNEYYETLALAVAAVAEGTEEPTTTITLLKDIEVDESVVIEGKNITIDGEGYTVKGADNTEPYDYGITPFTIRNSVIAFDDVTVRGGDTDEIGADTLGMALRAENSTITITDSTLSTGEGSTSSVVGMPVIMTDNISKISLEDVTLYQFKSTWSYAAMISVPGEGGNVDELDETSPVTISGTIEIAEGSNKLEAVPVVVADGETVEFVGAYSVEYISDTLYVQFQKADADKNGKDTDEYSDLYNIVILGNEQFINRLNSADLTFKLDSTAANDRAAKPVYEIIAVDPVNVTTDAANENRYMFSFDGVTMPDKTALADTGIIIGQVKISGYGSYELYVDGAVNENIVNTAETVDNIVENFYVGGKSEGDGDLILGVDFNDKDDLEETAKGEIVVPTRKLTINVDFPNAVVDNAYDYQDMLVVISGEDLANDIEYKLGTDVKMTDGAYVVECDKQLTLNTAYTVTVSGAGYRTARYTVTMTADKVLNFWNNVKDNALEVEEGKTTSAKTVTYLAGDIVKDSLINIYDLSAVVSYFGETELVGNNNAYAKYDLNRDGKIDSKDVAYVLVSWGK